VRCCKKKFTFAISSPDEFLCYRQIVVCLSVRTIVSPAKTAEAIEMPVGLWIRLGPRNHALDGVQISPCEKAILWGGAANLKVYGPSAVICAKTAEPIEMPFGMWTWVGPIKEARIMEVHIGATWVIRLNRACAAAMRPFCQITLTTCYVLIDN